MICEDCATELFFLSCRCRQLTLEDDTYPCFSLISSPNSIIKVHYSDFQSSGASKVHMGFPDISFWISPKKVCLVRREENSSRKGGALYISNRPTLHACITLSKLDEQTHERSTVAFWKVGGPISSRRFGSFLEKT
jgi:hypothetical protein